MKKVIIVLFVAVFALSMAAPVFAGAKGDQAKGGLEKIVKSPVNIVDDVKEEYEAADFKPFGVVGGVFKGLFNTAKDIVGGTVEVLTFPFASE